MRNGSTVSGPSFLTTLIFETKSTLHCHHLPIFANTSSNAVHSGFVTAIVSPAKPCLLKLTFSLKATNSKSIDENPYQSERTKH